MRRKVRALPEFFAGIDAVLPDDRTDILPSRADFQAYDLLDIVDRFADG